MMAAEVAAAAAERGPAGFEIAAAKILAGQAAASATRAAHQAHGAMGMTQEYPLQHLSRRLWSWRKEYGDDIWWSARLGRASAAAGGDLLYPSITGGSLVLAV
jgi:acyl-CoA dehydrogenase